MSTARGGRSRHRGKGVVGAAGEDRARRRRAHALGGSDVQKEEGEVLDKFRSPKNLKMTDREVPFLMIK